MKAAIIARAGADPVYGDFAEPVLDDSRELVDLVAAGIHPVVRSLASGRHYGRTATWPLIPGVDAVARTGDGVLCYTGFVEAPYGTLAERMAVPAGMRLVLPGHANPAQIAGGVNPGLASWLPLTAHKAAAGSLGTVVVLGATGMAGLLAVQNARLLGASRVIAAGRNSDALGRAAAAGADVVGIGGDRSADASSIAATLDGGSPSLVLDFVWGQPAEAMFEALTGRGLAEDGADISYVQIGALAGASAAVPSALLRSRRIAISGSGAGSASVAQIMAELPGYLQLIADGSVEVPVRTFRLSRIADAWSAAAERGPRVVVLPG
jgi:NADPH:quinone reductase-like Zn-dependent oxidoreductase